MRDIDYNCVITEDSCSNEDVVLVVDDYYNSSDICEVCTPDCEASAPDYTVVNDTKEDPSTTFYNFYYTL